MNNREDMIHVLPAIPLVLMLIGILAVPAYAQTSENVVINELDINPPGNDNNGVIEWVELYNPTDSPVDVSGWEIASTSILEKTLVIPDGTVMDPRDFTVFFHQRIWFPDIDESVELRDQNSLVIDKTPVLSDTANNFSTWQRISDGYDLDSPDDWKFASTTAGASNGQPAQIEEAVPLSMTVSTEELSYTLGQTAVIRGTVPEEMYTDSHSFVPAPIRVLVAGPNFEKTVVLYPDRNLDYSTTLNLRQVLGVSPGLYSVTVTYADQMAVAEFTVLPSDTGPAVDLGAPIVVLTDKLNYLPGQQVYITGTVSDVVQYRGITFTVIDPAGKLVADGSIFPVNGEFSTSVFISSVRPAYGTYTITAEYSRVSASASFAVLEDADEIVDISFSTAKSVFGLGDTVEITGRLNQVPADAPNLQIVQTSQSDPAVLSQGGAVVDYQILDEVQVSGDGSFAYLFAVPESPDRLGEYEVTVSSLGASPFSVTIHVVENPDEFVVPVEEEEREEDVTVILDKEAYAQGDTMVVTGVIKDPRVSVVYGSGAGLKIFISNADGTPLTMRASQNTFNTIINGERVVGYYFTVLPEPSGEYRSEIAINPNIFPVGKYVVVSQYSDQSGTAAFSVTDSLAHIDDLAITLDKTVYGLNETVSLSGVVPAIATPAASISVTKPDGTVVDSGTSINSQHFSWSWVTPVSERHQNMRASEDQRSVLQSNFGIYKIKVSVDSFHKEILFKVSPDPANDLFAPSPISVSAEKPLYRSGETLKVTGHVLQNQQASQGLLAPPRVTVQIADSDSPRKIIYESKVYPQQGGGFSSFFELPIGVFDEGTYLVKSYYGGLSSTATFSVVSDFTIGGDDAVSLLLSTDKKEYNPGDTVTITGKLNKLVHVETFDISIVKQTEDLATCGTVFCGVHGGPVTSLRPSPLVSFVYQFNVPDAESAAGSYRATVDAGFGTESLVFTVVEAEPAGADSQPRTVIIKENRIAQSEVAVFTPPTAIDGTDFAPRVLSGSMFTPLQADQLRVNLKVSTADGLCIIGPAVAAEGGSSDAGCLVSESTQRSGSIYDVVEIDGVSYNIRYTGPDVQLERFSILPESSELFLPDMNWNVEVLKDDQISRFYYKITYRAVQ